MVVWIKDSIRTLSISPAFGTLHSVLDEISQRSGVSVSAIHKIYDGRADNPTADTIDKLTRAIRQVTQKSAA